MNFNHTYIHSHTQLQTLSHTLTHTYVHPHTQLYTLSHTHTHTHTHTLTIVQARHEQLRVLLVEVNAHNPTLRVENVFWEGRVLECVAANQTGAGFAELV
jgi:hypothetical protein